MAHKNLTHAAAAAGLAAVLSLAAVTTSSAQRYYRHGDAPAYYGGAYTYGAPVPYGGLYDYAPGASNGYNGGNYTAPPDPASCGGFEC
jgi:hypothetical protein